MWVQRVILHAFEVVSYIQRVAGWYKKLQSIDKYSFLCGQWFHPKYE